MRSVPRRGSGWVRSFKIVKRDFVPTRYREVVLTSSKSMHARVAFTIQSRNIFAKNYISFWKGIGLIFATQSGGLFRSPFISLYS